MGTELDTATDIALDREDAVTIEYEASGSTDWDTWEADFDWDAFDTNYDATDYNFGTDNSAPDTGGYADSFTGVGNIYSPDPLNTT